MGRNTRIIIPATGVEYRKMKFMIYDVVHSTPEYPLQKEPGIGLIRSQYRLYRILFSLAAKWPLSVAFSS